jgi:hypothetical protein
MKVTGSVLHYDFGKTVEDGKFIQTVCLLKQTTRYTDDRGFKIASAAPEERERHRSTLTVCLLAMEGSNLT